MTEQIEQVLSELGVDGAEKGRRTAFVLPALQRLQRRFGYVPSEAIPRIADRLGVPASHIYGVATFYSQFRLRPVGRNIIRVCHGTACHVSGANAITKAAEDYLKIATGDTTTDRQFTLETVSCLGCCSLAPVIMINQATWGNLEPPDVKKILRKHKHGGDGGAES